MTTSKKIPYLVNKLCSSGVNKQNIYMFAEKVSFSITFNTVVKTEHLRWKNALGNGCMKEN